jgi:hypothetical protein
LKRWKGEAVRLWFLCPDSQFTDIRWCWTYFPSQVHVSPSYVYLWHLWQKRGWLCNTNEFVQSHFSDGFLIVRYINKMATTGDSGVVDGVTLRRLQAILVPGWNPNPDANLFFTNFCTNSYKRIHTIVIQIV